MSIAPVVRRLATDAFKGRAFNRTALVFACAVALTSTFWLGATNAAAGSPPYGIKPPPKPGLYDVTTSVAIAQVGTWVRRRPTLQSGKVRRLVFYTPDKEALQTYRIMTTHNVTIRTHRHRVKRMRKWIWVWDTKTTVWDEIAVPARPNGQSGWVESAWLGPVRTSHTLIVVNRAAEVMHVYRLGKLIFTAPVGTGDVANQTTTPPGHFWIAEAFPSSDPFYGPWAFGTTDYAKDTEFPDGSIVGIHGTNEPWLIPGDPSHGCVRMKDPDILKLKTLVGIGTAVWIQ